MADTYLVGALAEAHQEVVRLDVAVDEALAMYKLNPRDLCRAARSFRQSGIIPKVLQTVFKQIKL